MNHYKHVIWDFNGTILDDLDYSLYIVNQMLEKKGRLAIEREHYLKNFSMPVRNFYNIIMGPNLTDDDFEGLVQQWIPMYHENFLSCPLHSHFKEVLEVFNSKGKSQYVLSALEDSFLKKAMDHFNLTNYFVDIFGNPSHKGISKVEEGFLLLNKYQMRPSEVLIIGDTDHDAVVAKKLGIDCLLVAAGHQHDDHLRKQGHPVVSNLEELFKQLVVS